MGRIIRGTLAVLGAMVVLMPPVRAEQARVIHLTGTDMLTYSLPAITASPGELLEIVLKTTSMQPKSQLGHNFVLLRPPVDVNAFIMAAAMAKAQEYVPPDFEANIIVATGMAGAGETVRATFKAPSAPGRYPYVCTFPGHYGGGMTGTLVVR